jgi:hypothetical protein
MGSISARFRKNGKKDIPSVYEIYVSKGAVVKHNVRYGLSSLAVRTEMLSSSFNQVYPSNILLSLSARYDIEYSPGLC